MKKKRILKSLIMILAIVLSVLSNLIVDSKLTITAHAASNYGLTVKWTEGIEWVAADEAGTNRWTNGSIKYFAENTSAGTYIKLKPGYRLDCLLADTEWADWTTISDTLYYDSWSMYDNRTVTIKVISEVFEENGERYTYNGNYHEAGYKLVEVDSWSCTHELPSNVELNNDVTTGEDNVYGYVQSDPSNIAERKRLNPSNDKLIASTNYLNPYTSNSKYKLRFGSPYVKYTGEVSNANENTNKLVSPYSLYVDSHNVADVESKLYSEYGSDKNNDWLIATNYRCPDGNAGYSYYRTYYAYCKTSQMWYIIGSAHTWLGCAGGDVGANEFHPVKFTHTVHKYKLVESHEYTVRLNTGNIPSSELTELTETADKEGWTWNENGRYFYKTFVQNESNYLPGVNKFFSAYNYESAGSKVTDKYFVQDKTKNPTKVLYNWWTSASGGTDIGRGEKTYNNLYEISKDNSGIVNLYPHWMGYTTVFNYTDNAPANTAGLTVTINNSINDGMDNCLYQVYGSCFFYKGTDGEYHDYEGINPDLKVTASIPDSNGYKYIFNGWHHEKLNYLTNGLGKLTYKNDYNIGQGKASYSLSPHFTRTGISYDVRLHANVPANTESTLQVLHQNGISSYVYDSSNRYFSRELTYDYLQDMLSPSVYSLKGYHLLSTSDWYTESTGGNIVSAPCNNTKAEYPDWAEKNWNLTTTDGTTVNLYARWQANSYKISYNLDGGTHGTSHPDSAEYDSTVTISNPTKTGYTFTGWTITGYDKETSGHTDSTWTGETRTDYRNLTATDGATVTFTAIWSKDVPKTANLQTTGDVGIKTTSHAAKTVVNIGNSVQVSAVLKTGYAFAGWYNGNTKISDNLNFTYTMPNTDTVLTAKTNPVIYSITYNLNGGALNGKTNPISYTVETDTFTLNNPTRAGYTFAGWSGTDITGTSKTVTVNQGSTGNRTYTATWTPVNYTISYDLNGGAVAVNNPTSYNIETPTFTLNNPVKIGYIFAGWTGSNGTTPQKSVSIYKGSTGNKSYKANWTAADVGYTVNHYIMDINGNYLSTPTKIERLSGFTDTSVTPERLSLGNGFTYPDVQTVKVKADGTTVVNYYYSRNQYYLNLNGYLKQRTDTNGNMADLTETVGNLNGTNSTYTYAAAVVKINGSVHAKGNGVTDFYEKVYYGSTYEIITTAKTGYTIIDNTETLTGTVNGDTTVAPRLSINSYTISYEPNKPSKATENLTKMSDQKIYYNRERNLTENTYKYTGYDFIGWNTKADGTGTAYSNTQAVKNLSSTDGSTITLYAQWKIHTHKLKVYVSNENADGTFGSEWLWQDKILEYNTTYSYTGYVNDTVYQQISTSGTMYDSDITIHLKAMRKTFNQKLTVYYEQPDGSFDAGTVVINKAYRYGQTVSWNRNADVTYKAASISWTVAGANVKELKVYRQQYTVTVKAYDNKITSVSGSGTYRYGRAITIDAAPVIGYHFLYWNANKSLNMSKYSFTVTGNVTYTAYAAPNTDTPYKVEHYKMNLDGTTYTLADTDNLKGTTDTSVTPAVKTYEGFTSPSTQTVTIKGDGTTVVKYYYIRNKYTLDLNGLINGTLRGNLADVVKNPITGAEDRHTAGTAVVTVNGTVVGNKVTDYCNEVYYGSSISIITTAESGYSIIDNDNVSFKMPAEDKTVTVTINAKDTKYLVRHWKKNVNTDSKTYNENSLNDSNYTMYDAEYLNGKAYSWVKPVVRTLEGFTYKEVLPSEGTAYVKPDGTTVIDVYYTRNTYTINGGNVNDANVEYGNGISSVSGLKTYEYEQKVTLTANLKTGYHWHGTDKCASSGRYPTGWYGRNNSGVDGILTDNTTYNSQTIKFNMPARNVYLGVKATNNSYTVVYNKNQPVEPKSINNVTGSTESQTFIYDESQNLRNNGFTLTGYTRKSGWMTASSKSGNGTADFSYGQSVKNLTTVNLGTVNLYAIWEDNTPEEINISSTNDFAAIQTVTLTARDYGSGIDYISFGKDEKYEKAACNADGSVTFTRKVNASGTYIFSVKDKNGKVSKKTITFYQTTLNTNKNNIVSSDGKSVIESDFTSVPETLSTDISINEAGKSITPVTKRDGVDFLGWSTDRKGKTGIMSIKADGNKTYYAIWKDTKKPVAVLEGVTSNLSASQTITFKLYDTAEGKTNTGSDIAGYYIGTNPDAKSNTKKNVTADKNGTYSGSETITLNGETTYYIFPYDKAGNIGDTIKLKSTGNNNTPEITPGILFHRVDFNANGSTDSPATVNIPYAVIPHGSTITMPTAYRLGYHDYTGSDEQTADNDGKTSYWGTDSKAVTGFNTLKVTKSQTCFALWKANKYTITLVSNKPDTKNGYRVNSTYSPENDTKITVTFDEVIPFSKAKNPEITGWTFKGYAFNELSTSDNNNSKTVISTNQKFGLQFVKDWYKDAGKTFENVSDITLYAAWSENRYTVNYNTTGGTALKLNRITYWYEDEFSLPDATGDYYNTFMKLEDNKKAVTTYRPAHHFVMWKCVSDENSNGDVYSSGGKAVRLVSKNNGECTLNAVWKQKQIVTLNITSDTFKESMTNDYAALADAMWTKKGTGYIKDQTAIKEYTFTKTSDIKETK